MQKMGGWHQNRNRHLGVRLDHSGSFRNAHRGRGGYGTGIHTAEGGNSEMVAPELRTRRAFSAIQCGCIVPHHGVRVWRQAEIQDR